MNVNPLIQSNEVFGLWIIDAAGILIYSKKSQESSVNDDLFGCFISAISVFAKEISNLEIQELIFGNSILLYQRTNEIITILGIRSDSDLKIWRTRLLTVSEAFFGMFADILPRKFRSKFNTFDFVLEALFNEWESQIKTNVEGTLVPKRKIEHFKKMFYNNDLKDKIFDKFGNNGTDVLFSINGQRSVIEIHKRLGTSKSIDQTIKIIEWALANRLIEPMVYEILPSSYIPIPSMIEKIQKEGSDENQLYIDHFGKDALSIIENINGRNSVGDIAMFTGMAIQEVKGILEYILQLGWIN